MSYHQFNILALTLLAVGALAGSSFAQPLGPAGEILVCPLLHAKAVPQGFPVAAMKFTGPAGDGRRGSAGFVVQSRDLIKGDGTHWKFIFQRDASGFGFQVIHPLEKGHVVLSVHSRGVTIHPGGAWGNIGWGDPATSEKVLLTAATSGILPLKAGRPYRIDSRLSGAGEYQLLIDDALVCQGKVEKAEPLRLTVPLEKRVWGGSSWDHTQFAGEGFSSILQTGHTGLILGPMDGAGPRQFLKQATLAALTGMSAQAVDEHVAPLLSYVDNAREAGKLIRSKAAGGGGGGAFEVIPDQPALLVGFEYTTSTFYGGHLTIKSVRPIFRGRGGEVVGKWHGAPHGKARRLEARKGYAVAGMVAKSGHRIDGLQLIYMRVKNGRLNADDTYRSEWIGGRGGGGETLYAADENPVVGVYGRQGRDVDAIGFIQVAAK